MVTRSHKYTMQQYRILRSKAASLRKRGLSYKEIMKEIPVSKSTISEWCYNIPLSKKQILRLGAKYDSQLRGAKANHKKSLERISHTREKALSEINKIDFNFLKGAGAMLYWAEGTKKGSPTLANSDPTLVVFFVEWLKKILGVEVKNISASLNMHRGQSDRKEKAFWSQLTGIPLCNFKKTFFKPEGTGHRKNILHHGTIRIRAGGAGTEQLRHRIMGWAEAVARHFVTKELINIHYRGRTGR